MFIHDLTVFATTAHTCTYMITMHGLCGLLTIIGRNRTLYGQSIRISSFSLPCVGFDPTIFHLQMYMYMYQLSCIHIVCHSSSNSLWAKYPYQLVFASLCRIQSHNLPPTDVHVPAELYTYCMPQQLELFMGKVSISARFHFPV